MKRIFIIAALSALVVGCGNNDSKTATTPATTATAPADRKLTPEEERGETLIAQSDCLGCHKIEEKLQGPAYREVAAKYASAPAGINDTLAQHIIKGHVGTWGQVPMTAHPTLTEADAKAMVTYILGLK